MILQAYELGRDDEARRIARALHDEASQLLVSANLALEMLVRDLPTPHRTAAQRVRELLDAMDKQLRSVAKDLHPPIDDLGLMPAVELLARGASCGGQLSVEVRGSPGERLVRAYETTLYRIVQEGLANVVQHARAKHAVVEFERAQGEVRCIVRDDGIGLERAHGPGLGSIHARLRSLGGSLEIQSERGRGTEIRAHLPLEESA